VAVDVPSYLAAAVKSLKYFPLRIFIQYGKYLSSGGKDVSNIENINL
jgi:hypothetical protein